MSFISEFKILLNIAKAPSQGKIHNAAALYLSQER